MKEQKGYSFENAQFFSKQEGPRALDRLPESWYMSRCCIGLWLKRYDLKIYLFSDMVAMLSNQAGRSNQFS